MIRITIEQVEPVPREQVQEYPNLNVSEFTFDRSVTWVVLIDQFLKSLQAMGYSYYAKTEDIAAAIAEVNIKK